MTVSCRLCGHPDCPELQNFGQQPNSLALLSAPDEQERTFPLALHHCPMCDFVFLPEGLPPEAIYDELQPPTSTFPPRHLPWLVNQAAALARQKPNAPVLEIGCNDGHFLGLLRARGVDQIFGLDPSAPCVELARAKGIDIKVGYFNQTEADAFLRIHGQPHLIICRHVLEHVMDLGDFVTGLTKLLGETGVLLLELPDLDAITRLGDLSAVWEQHVNYFDLPVLQRLFARHGLHLREAEALPHGGGSLLAFFSPTGAAEILPALTGRTSLLIQLQRTMDTVHDTFERLHANGQRIMAFGAGMRGTMLINLTKIGPFLEGVVDDNPSKVGRYLPGCRLPIVPSKKLLEHPPDVLMILPLNSKEAEQRVMTRYTAIASQGCRLMTYLTEDGQVLG